MCILVLILLYIDINKVSAWYTKAQPNGPQRQLYLGPYVVYLEKGNRKSMKVFFFKMGLGCFNKHMALAQIINYVVSLEQIISIFVPIN